MFLQGFTTQSDRKGTHHCDLIQVPPSLSLSGLLRLPFIKLLYCVPSLRLALPADLNCLIDPWKTLRHTPIWELIGLMVRSDIVHTCHWTIGNNKWIFSWHFHLVLAVGCTRSWRGRFKHDDSGTCNSTDIYNEIIDRLRVAVLQLRSETSSFHSA